MSHDQEAPVRGNPVIRWLLLLVGVVVVIVVVAVIAYSAFMSSRNMPLAVDVYPDSRLIGEAILDQGHDRVRYANNASAEDVGQFYVQALGEDNCSRLDNSAEDSGGPAFSLRCMVDGSSFFVTQYTIVIVQPGVDEYAGQTLIDMERVWGQ
jgi:hypothetical protein